MDPNTHLVAGTKTQISEDLASAHYGYDNNDEAISDPLDAVKLDTAILVFKPVPVDTPPNSPVSTKQNSPGSIGLSASKTTCASSGTSGVELDSSLRKDSASDGDGSGGSEEINDAERGSEAESVAERLDQFQNSDSYYHDQITLKRWVDGFDSWG